MKPLLKCKRLAINLFVLMINYQKILIFRYIPDKWKLILEQYAYIAEKKQVSSRSLLMHCEYFKKIKEQKQNLNQIVIKNTHLLNKICTLNVFVLRQSVI